MDTYQDLINKAERVRELVREIQVLFLFSNEKRALNSQLHDRLNVEVGEYKSMVDSLKGPAEPVGEE